MTYHPGQVNAPVHDVNLRESVQFQMFTFHMSGGRFILTQARGACHHRVQSRRRPTLVWIRGGTSLSWTWFTKMGASLSCHSPSFPSFLLPTLTSCLGPIRTVLPSSCICSDLSRAPLYAIETCGNRSKPSCSRFPCQVGASLLLQRVGHLTTAIRAGSGRQRCGFEWLCFPGPG